MQRDTTPNSYTQKLICEGVNTNLESRFYISVSQGNEQLFIVEDENKIDFAAYGLPVAEMSGSFGEEKLPMLAVMGYRTLLLMCGKLERNRLNGWMWRRTHSVPVCVRVVWKKRETQRN